MSVTKEQVLATAALCRLDLRPDAAEDPAEADRRLERLAAQLDAVIGYMDILNQVDTENVEPLYSTLRDPAPPRADLTEKKRTAAEILANAPERRENFFVVPPVI
ncbi:MAG: Asp-tRNA(Asn)/Glu-tRNA(Gln) amidotransferase subunit GatC [Desulfovibrio sp.]|jgi:aspartyl-tRNA(Asn)/glutamyl-tRNA(Gln) amidotransferase subunit C|nr:Asp-tRNA(Asn)/Glu-tRNA(Gln) amidotransferase subunit GatC [Desulfovibrio sp.]